MKKLIITVILISVLSFQAYANSIVSVEEMEVGGGISYYLNFSNGDSTRFGIENLSCYAVEGDGLFIYDVNYHTNEGKISVDRTGNGFSLRRAGGKMAGEQQTASGISL